jgi:uncharacterized protein (DUF608 family)
MSWPVAHTYGHQDRARISLPVGGIGTGTVGFGGRGQFRDWELENHPSKGLSSALTFLSIWCRGASGEPVARVLEGALFDDEVEGEQGSPAPVAGLPRFHDCHYEATYPFGRAVLGDQHVPVRASVEMFNPLVPGDEDVSGLPIAIITVVLESDSDEPLDCSVMFSCEALTGHASRRAGLPSRPVARRRSEGGAEGYFLSDEFFDAEAEGWGSIALAALGEGSWTGPIWGLGKWNQGISTMWRGFMANGMPDEGVFGVGQEGPAPTFGSAVAGTVGARKTLPPRGRAEVVFLMGWHFPNRHSWVAPANGPRGISGPEIIGNFYATSYRDAWDVVARHAPRVTELRRLTEQFVNGFWSTDLSAQVKEAALFNLSTLRSQTFFRDADGNPLAWEGCMDDVGSCFGSCTHVWNYDLATPFVWGGLARRMREIEYLYATAEDGAMSFRTLVPLDRAGEWAQTAADGQFGCVVKLYREWRLSGDDAWLQRLWPSCRRSIEFAWIEGGWDGDRDGLAEGPQHNTMDVEYYGPNPMVQSWYLAALEAAAEMAAAVGDSEFASTCLKLFATGTAATEEQLFNGFYYQQRIIPPRDFSTVPAKLRHPNMGAENPDDPEFQVGDGCEVDQLVGDTYARLVGLAPVYDEGHSKTALSSVHRLNYVDDFANLTNYVRTYVVDGERGHMVLSYPNGLPEHPMPYWCESWTGLEYVFAMGCAQAGELRLAEDVVVAVRERFSGRRRNPFDEAECGHHYGRALASWGLVLALAGFHYDGRDGSLAFDPAGKQGGRWFWSTGGAFGTVELAGDDSGTTQRLHVLGGTVRVERVRARGLLYTLAEPGLLGPGDYELQRSGEPAARA